MRLRVLTAALAAILLWPAWSAAQPTGTYEALTVDDTARFVSGATMSGMSSCVAVVETGPIRWRNDDILPTAAVGTPVAVGTAINFQNVDDLRRARFIRSTAVSGVLHVNCFSRGNVGVTGSGGSAELVFEGNINAFDGVLRDAPAGDPLTDLANNALRANVIATVGLTDTQLRATAVPVSGTVTANLSATDNAVLDAIEGHVSVTGNIEAYTSRLLSSAGPAAPGVAAATTAFVVGGTYNSGGVTLTNGQQSGVQLSSTGRMLVELPAGGTGLTDTELRATPVPVSGTVNLGATDTVNLGSVATNTGYLTSSRTPIAPGAATATTAIAAGGTYNAAGVTLTDGQQAGLQLDESGRLRITNIDMLTALVAIEGGIDAIESKLALDASHGNPARSDGPQVMYEAATIGSFPAAVSATQATRPKASTNGVTYTALTNAAGTADYGATLQAIANQTQPGTGVLIRSDNTNNDDKTEIKATAGVLLSISGRNAHATTAAYVRCTNATGAGTTPGTTTVIYEMILPPGNLGFVQGSLGPGGMTFSTALTCYIATGKAVTDTTDAAQDDVVVNVVYR